MKSPVKQLRYYLEWVAIKCMKLLIPLVPRALLLPIAKNLGTAAYIFDRRGRKTGIANVRAVNKLKKLSKSNSEELILKSYQQFALSMCDLFWSSNINKTNYSKFIQVEFENKKAIEKASRNGAIWVTPHYGNFELISLVMGFRNIKFTVVAQDFRNPRLTAIFKRAREHSGHKVISSKRAVVRLLKTLRSDEHVAFLTDLTVAPGAESVPVQCFSLITSVTRLHAFLNSKTNAPIIPGISIPCSDGTYIMKILSPLKIPEGCDQTAIAQKCWDVFEPYISEFPEPWIWMYRHWKYKPRETIGVNYPYYSHVSKKFDSWIKESSEN